MTRTVTTLLALAASALLSTHTQAQQGPSGVVLGVAGGLSKFNDSCEGASRCDTTDRALRFNAGYGFGNGLVVEAVAFDFGQLKGTSLGIDVEIGATALGGGVAYHAPLSPRSALFGRLGVAQVKTKVKATGPGGTVGDSESQTAAYAGIGFAWTLSERSALEVAWETTQMKYGGEKASVSAATLGLSLRF